MNYKNIKLGIRTIYDNYIRFQNKKLFGKFGVNSVMYMPVQITDSKLVFIDKNVQIMSHATILNPGQKFTVKKYTSIAHNLTVVTSSHRSTVGIPHFILDPSHINDKAQDIIIEEDVWLGANVTLLPGAHIGRGAVVGANSIVNSSVPPYACVVGTPQRIVSVVFSIDDIITHELGLYSESERFLRDYLESIFEQYFKGMKIFGSSTISEADKVRIEEVKKMARFIND